VSIVSSLAALKKGPVDSSFTNSRSRVNCSSISIALCLCSAHNRALCRVPDYSGREEN
jgi:hypothetical protein